MLLMVLHIVRLQELDRLDVKYTLEHQHSRSRNVVNKKNAEEVLN